MSKRTTKTIVTLLPWLGPVLIGLAMSAAWTTTIEFPAPLPEGYLADNDLAAIAHATEQAPYARWRGRDKWTWLNPVTGRAGHVVSTHEGAVVNGVRCPLYDVSVTRGDGSIAHDGRIPLCAG